MRFGIIYKITCLNNENYLYGSTLNINKRKNSYFRQLSRNIYNNQKLQNCYNKYGKNSIKFEIVQENIPENILKYVEDIWMGANCSRIEDKKGGMNMRDAHRGNISIETRIKMSKSQTGKKLSEETKKLKSKIAKERNLRPSNKATELSKIKRSKKVIQYSLNGDFIKIWDSIREAKLKTKSDNITECCKNGSKQSSGGFQWKYFTENYSLKIEKYKNKKFKKIKQFDLDGNFIKEWGCMKEAAIFLNVNYNQISAVCNNRGKTAYGYMWKFS